MTITEEAALEPTTAATRQLRVFISYSRDDSEFADELEQGLKLLGYAAFIDRQMSGGEVWKQSLAHHIAQADTVVFVLSPSSTRSETCHWEVSEARRQSKRILPVVPRPVTDEPVPEQLQNLNYIFFTEDRSFLVGLSDLKEALDKDHSWIREHTRYGDLARRWKAHNQDPSQLLTGTALTDAKAWEKQWSSPNPEPTDELRAFIGASDQAETIRLSEQTKRANVLRRALIASLVFAILAGGGGLWALAERARADSRTAEAVLQTAKAKLRLVQAQSAAVDLIILQATMTSLITGSDFESARSATKLSSFVYQSVLSESLERSELECRKAKRLEELASDPSILLSIISNDLIGPSGADPQHRIRSQWRIASERLRADYGCTPG